MLFAYWDVLRGERAAPDRGEVKPGEMRHILADAFMLARAADGAASFRLAGTRISALFGRELGGAAFTDLWAARDRNDVRRLVDIVAEDTVGAAIGLLGANENGSEIALEMMLLPLRHRGRTNDRMLGALSPALLPSWAGLVPLRRIESTSVRIIEPGRSTALPPRPTGGIPQARKRNLFVVHEGGRV